MMYENLGMNLTAVPARILNAVLKLDSGFNLMCIVVDLLSDKSLKLKQAVS